MMKIINMEIMKQHSRHFSAAKKLIATLLLAFFGAAVYAQSPAVINYQGIARDAEGVPYTNQEIALEFKFYQGSAASRTLVLSEVQNDVLTNKLGLFSTQIGKTKTGGLSTIDWDAGDLFLEVLIDVDNGTPTTSMGLQQLVNSPFAFHASSVPTTFTNNILTVGKKTYTLSYTPPTAITSTGGIANISSSGTNSFNIDVPAPIYNPANGNLTTGTVVTNISPSLGISGNTLSVGGNTLTLPTTSITGTGIATATNSGHNFTVDVP
ncbi:MAG: hypothetical protein KF900_13640, partial [Bacteroidetes bacterium]|nr:hypothetical protein [Bacteroidota bacterium]